MSKLKEIQDRINRRRAWLHSTVSTDVVTNTFAYVKGRAFERWIDNIQAGSRSNGYNTGDLIDNPAYIIESLLRDENFVERDLRISVKTDTSNVIVNDLASSDDDYYNYALYYNATTGHKTYITDYDGGTKTLTLASADTSVAANDNIFLTNIQGDNKIDYASFDAVGNTTNGTRKDWVFERSFTEKQNIRDIISELCFESHCELVESVNPDRGRALFKLKALDTGSADTWTNPVYQDGLEQIRISFTPIESIFTQFRLRYFYDYGKGDFIKEIYVDKKGYPTTATILSDTEKNLCADAEAKHNLFQLFEYESRNIYDDATAERFLQKKIGWFTKQRMIVSFRTLINTDIDFIKYELGDLIKINFSQGLPTGVNNSTIFMITNKRINPTVGGGYLDWELIEI